MAAATAATRSAAHAASSSALSAQEQFLLDRITFGRSPQMVTEIQNRGYMGFLDWQLQLAGQTTIDDSKLFDPPSGSFPGGAAHLDSPQISHPWGLTPAEIFLDSTYPVQPPNQLNQSYPGPISGAMVAHAPHCIQMGASSASISCGG